MSQWDAEFDNFIDILRSAVVDFLPWVLRACNTFKTLVGGWTLEADWERLAGLYEYGVDTQWAVNAHRADAPASRVALTLIGRAWPKDFLTASDPLGLAALKDSDYYHKIESMFSLLIGRSGEGSPLGRDLSRLRDWLIR